MSKKLAGLFNKHYFCTVKIKIKHLKNKGNEENNNHSYYNKQASRNHITPSSQP